MYIGNDLQIANPSYKIIDDISSSFNGSTTSFALQVSGVTPVPFPINEQQVMISVNGVVQEPDPSGSAGFKLLGSNIIFSSAPANGNAFFGVILAGADYVTAGSEFPDGTVNAPSFTFSADQDSGWYRIGSGSTGYTSNGVQTLNFDGNGLTIAAGKGLTVDTNTLHVDATNNRVGIGLTNPQRTVHLSSNNTVLALTDTAASTDQKTKYILSDAGIFAVGKLNDAYDTAVEHFRIDNDSNATFAGKLGLGTSPAAATTFFIVRTSTDHNLEIEETAGDLRISALNNARDTNIALEFAASSYDFANGNATFAGSVYIPDNEIIGFGDPALPDLRIYHENSGSNGMIFNKTGDLYIQGNDGSGNAQTAIQIHDNGAVDLKYAGTGPKLETTATGIKVSGADSNDQIKIVASGTNANGVIDFESPGTGGGIIKTQGTTALTLDNSQNATFAGEVRTAGNKGVIIGDATNAANPYFSATRPESGDYIGYLQFEGHQTDYGGFTFKNNVGNVLTIDRLTGNATFAGNVTLGGGTSPSLTINASTHDASTANEAKVEFKYNQSHANDSIGYIKLVENANNSYDGYLSFGVPYNNSSTPGTRDDVLKLNFDNSATFAGSAEFSSNIGVGISPSHALDVHKSDSSGVIGLHIRNANNTAGNNTEIRFQGTNSSNSAFTTGRIVAEMTDNYNQYSDLHFYAHALGSTTKKLTLKGSTGAFGIGTGSPDQLLHISSATNPVIRLENTDASLDQDQLIGGIEWEKQDASGAGVGIVGEIKLYSDDSYGARSYLSFSTRHSSTGGSAVATESLRIKADGDVSIINGNLIVADGHGIDFSATSDATGKTSELLDDYEEGTFTVAVTTHGNAPTLSGTTSWTGKYTKVGNLVHVSAYILSLNVDNAGTSSLKITGLPFVANNYTTIAITHDTLTASDVTNGFTTSGTTYLNSCVANGTAGSALATGSSKFLMFAGSYRVN